MKPKIIRTEGEYQEALAYLESLMESQPGSPQAEELELFAYLVENYEKEHFPLDLPDPISAIEFRMEQQGLTRKDLQKYLGSQSKVSEVMSGKRPLSLSMIRKLHEGLGIPAEVLLQEKEGHLAEAAFHWKDFPFAEMFKAGYFSPFNGTLAEAKEYAEELLRELFAVFQGHVPQRIYCKRGDQNVNENALSAWQAQVLAIIKNEQLPPFDRKNLDDAFIQKLVQLSYYERGAQLVKEFLNKKGIHFVVLPHLEKTYMDGAAFLTPQGRPVIALTLRHDRLDNFWFTLMHEMGHVFLHLKDTGIAFFDDTINDGKADDHPGEQEANQFARNALIPKDYWQVNLNPQKEGLSKVDIMAHAEQLEIDPAIIAGRIRWEINNFRKYNDMIGHNKVKKQFQIGGEG